MTHTLIIRGFDDQAQIQSQKDMRKYCNTIIENVVKNAHNKPVCCMDFLINDVGKDSLKQALTLESL